MASTRNKNTRGNYVAEQNELEKHRLYNTRAYGVANENPRFAGDGLLVGKMTYNELAFNGSDIESQLFGIGSTNLVSASTGVTPQLKHLGSLAAFAKPQVIMPNSFFVHADQRPMYLN